MAEFIPVTPWNHYNVPTSQRSLQHLRTESYSHAKAPPNLSPAGTRPVSKSVSSSELRSMATAIKAPSMSRSASAHYEEEDGNMTTLPDPRSRTLSVTDSNSPSQHPDLNSEVATLSNKLINAINHQTVLDDTLSATRHDLETSQERCLQLEEERKTQAALADQEKNKLLGSLAEEKRLRAEAEKEKKNIELEVENLTAALFEEANKMVITAREAAKTEQDIIQKRNDQLKAQLKDTESLLKSHQDQLAELKQVMEQMNVERDDLTNPTAPSTPGLSKFDSKDEDTVESYAVQAASIPEPVSPSNPTSFTHLLSTVLRTDLSAYDEFTSLLKMSRNIAGSRVSSGSYGTSIGLGLGLGGYVGTSMPPSNGSSSSLATSGTLGSAPATPTTPASSVSAGSLPGPNSLTPLKDTKFYKRSYTEDIEPTLRLDTAPGLSWLARRTVLNSICDGTLVVEPMPSSTKPYSSACSLCGENRKDTDHTRSHRFRTSEQDNAQRYALCKYCLGRLRSTCDFIGFLRILKDGHWRAEDEESEKAAWEESVRLREQMFWSRIGGGVVPAASHHHHHGEVSRSPRVSEDRPKEESEEEERMDEFFEPKDVSPKAVSQDAPADTLSAHEPVVDDNSTPKPTEDSVEPKTPENGQKASRASTQSSKSLQAGSPAKEETDNVQRLSITIPGAFD